MRQYRLSELGDIEFVASVAQVNRAQLREIVTRLEEVDKAEYGLKRVMFCPLTSRESSVKVIKELAEEYDVKVSCDSGGYESQVNDDYSMQDIYQFDRRYYLSNDWPHELVLPDQVPVEGDSEEVIEEKVRDTISLSKLLYGELPVEKQKKAVPVVQGHTKQQIVDCLGEYTQLENISKIGFGSFGTGGVNGGVNYLNEQNIELLQFVVKEARKYDLDVHAFGIGGPTSIPILYQCGVDTFDSTGWMRSAGYGNVFFPFKSRLNITHLRDRSGPTVFREEIRGLKEETNHDCPFCRSFEELQESRLNRILHNLLVMREMTHMIREKPIGEVLDMMNPRSRYTGYLESMAVK